MDHCAPGYTWKEKVHNIWVYYNNKTYANLPKQKEIAVGHIRKMLRHLGVDPACAGEYIEQLREKPRSPVAEDHQ